MFIAVVAWTPENRIAKYQDFATQAEAEAHIAKVGQGFVTSDPGGNFADWLVDPAAKALTLSPLPVKASVPSDMAVMRQALIDKTLLTQADLDAAKAKLSG